MADDALYDALMRRYGKVYDPEANARALAEKEERERQKAEMAALITS